MPGGFSSAFVSCFLTIVASEIADKTFFIAALLAMKQSRLRVFIGCFSALFFMNFLSAVFGFVAPAIIPIEWTYMASIVLFIVTGIISLNDAAHSTADASTLEEVKNEVKDINGKRQGWSLLHPVIIKAFLLTFVSEWGDKSQLVTIGLGATKDVMGVILGGGAGHALCTSMAVIGGQRLASHFNERLVSGISGVLFIVFGLFALWTGRPCGFKRLAVFSFGFSFLRPNAGGFNTIWNPAAVLNMDHSTPPINGSFDGSTNWYCYWNKVATYCPTCLYCWSVPNVIPHLSTTSDTQSTMATTFDFDRTSQMPRDFQLQGPAPLMRCSKSEVGSFNGNPKTKRSGNLESMARAELPICYDFVQGKCRRTNCRYQHDFGAVIRHNARESRVCFDHLRGECTRGNLCRFSHDIRRLVFQGMEEAAYPFVMEPTANGICYDFCRGACPRRGTCPWTHNLIEIAWNTAKQPLLDSHKVTMKVLNVIKGACPRHIAEAAIDRMIAQPSLQLKILSLNLNGVQDIDAPAPSVTSPSTMTKFDSMSFGNSVLMSS